ncbi:hypothetical protein E2C06_25820 [Dankookia rubra]|uniref:Uncharacterized protein n=1 Tax=Dankookia rubra TaxID=1442381 RepID=A0A4R5Q9S1_9PROT|nr:hypothetical protein [Dankookia rubra]TDH59754.1 hypothetical protein E2C06_25820 [Dankookia rubra]
MAELVRRAMDLAIKVNIRFEDDAGVVRCDPNKPGSAILSLHVNVPDTIPQGGRLVISTADLPLGRADLANNDGALPGDYFEIRA